MPITPEMMTYSSINPRTDAIKYSNGRLPSKTSSHYSYKLASRSPYKI